MKIIPAIDLYQNQCIRLVQGDLNAKTIYPKTPLEYAKLFENMGNSHLHLVDLEGAFTGTPKHFETLKLLAKNTSLNIDYSGGLRNLNDIETAFELGAKQVVIGSLALINTQLIEQLINKWGPQSIIISADSRNGKVAIKGWTENTELQIESCILFFKKIGVEEFICTEISKDGAMNGPATAFYKKLISTTSAHIIASGGIRNKQDVDALEESGCLGAIIGKSLIENTFQSC